MFPGAHIILSCPHCDGLAKLVLPDEIDFMPDMVTWTDGWQTTSAPPVPPRVTKCPNCQRAFWVGEAPQLGLMMPGQPVDPEKAAWAEAPAIARLDAAGVQQALDEGLGSFAELELELRVQLWWRGNDEFRVTDSPVGYSTSPGAVANMERMIELVTSGEEDLLLFRAEAQRHLGKFEDAKVTLDGVCCSDYWPAKRRQLELIEAGSRKLDVLFLPLAPEENPEAPAEVV